MNEKAKTLLKNLNYTITANFMVLGISVILNLVVPKYLGVTDYGYWQLYVFYSSYVGFFHLGWIDGIYLKIGGEEYDNLDKKNLGTQFYYLFFFQLILASALALFSLFFVSDYNKQIVWFSTSAILVAYNLRYFILFILQSTNRIKEYAQLSRNDRYLYLFLILIYLLMGGRNYVIFILLDILTKFIFTIWGISRIKDIIFSKKQPIKIVFPEIWDNVKIGSNLMLGNIASLLILGVSRFLVEAKWGIEVFGELSFALSISNMFMNFIGAVSVVLYPILRRTDQSNLSNLYIKARTIFVPLTLMLLILFNPSRVLIEWWLPEYKISLFYMGILFPMIVYEGRVSLLVNTYLKTIREEKIILFSNILTLLISAVTSLISVYILNSIYIATISILFSLIFRCIFAEILLSKILNINVIKDNLIEGVLVLFFVISNLFLTSTASFLLYGGMFLMYIIITYKKILYSTRYFVLLTKNK